MSYHGRGLLRPEDVKPDEAVQSALQGRLYGGSSKSSHPRIRGPGTGGSSNGGMRARLHSQRSS